MPGVNKVIILGNLGADPDARDMPDGDKVVNLSVATSETWRDKQTGEKRERTEWHRVVIFNQALGKVATDYLKKGSRVYLEGLLQTRKWSDQSGQDRYTTEIVLQRYRGELQLLGDGGGGGGNRPPPAQSESDYGKLKTDPASGRPRAKTEADFQRDVDDEIPF